MASGHMRASHIAFGYGNITALGSFVTNIDILIPQTFILFLLPYFKIAAGRHQVRIRKKKTKTTPNTHLKNQASTNLFTAIAELNLARQNPQSM